MKPKVDYDIILTERMENLVYLKKKKRPISFLCQVRSALSTVL